MDEYPQEIVELKHIFQMPDHEYSYHNHMNANKYRESLDEIKEQCRTVRKYMEDPSDDLLKFADEIESLAYEYTREF